MQNVILQHRLTNQNVFFNKSHGDSYAYEYGEGQNLNISASPKGPIETQGAGLTPRVSHSGGLEWDQGRCISDPPHPDGTAFAALGLLFENHYLVLGWVVRACLDVLPFLFELRMAFTFSNG